MESGDIQKIIGFLKQRVDFAEAYQVTSFTGFRQNPTDGEIKQINIDILDAGPEATMPRYQLFAHDEDGRIAHGEAADTVDAVLAGVHWFHLNEPPSEEAEDEDDLGGQIEIVEGKEQS
ncbi:MAG: hypothetical protein ACYC3S_14430 [Chloroflexota bacterium]